MGQESLRTIEERLERLEAQMNAPETYADPALFARLARERKTLIPAAEASRRVRSLEADIAAAQELDFSAEELAALRKEKAEAERALKLALLPQDPDDGRSVIMELRAGTGGEEAALFAADLFRMYSMYAATRGWRIELADVSRTELGGVKEAVFTVEGEGAWKSLKYESGVHQVKRVPETESSGRIQTSTATVAVLPEMDEVDFALDLKDVRIDVFRASGAGGQKVNKTSSCVCLTHRPTGLQVKCQSSRSLTLNRYHARVELCERLAERIAGEKSLRQQEAEKIRRQKRRRSRRAKAKMLADKHAQSEKKALRRRPGADE